jgi:hypothetical protein
MNLATKNVGTPFAKSIAKFCFALLLGLGGLANGLVYAQPSVMSINQDVSGTYANTTMDNKGVFFQKRFQENGSGTASGTRNWQFNSDSYFNQWGTTAGAGVQTLAGYNQQITPNTGTASANWTAAAYNSNGRLPATQANYYYTYNIIKGSSYASQNMAVLETQFNPRTFVSESRTAPVTWKPTIVRATMSGAPATGENVFVRYSTDNFVTSSFVQLSFVGSLGSAEIPAFSAATTVRYYFLSSPVTPTHATADVLTLELLNNAGANYSYTSSANNVLVTSATGTAISATYATVAAAVTAINAGVLHTGTIECLVNSGHTETVPAGGISIGNVGSVSAPITFVKYGTGANPTFTAPNPAGTAGALNDAIFKIIGGDYITIDGFTMLENAANTTTAAASNNMVEFGVALFYATTTNGAQNNTIKNCTIDLNRTYQNTWGIYSNSTHSATNMTTSATATGSAGSNNGLVVTGNTITDVNQGILVIGATAAADHNSSLTIGGSAGNANTITNWGTTATFSSYANVSGTLNCILIRNTKGFTISHNTITSSNGGHTVGANIRGIFLPSFSNAPTGTFTNSISNNTISIRSGLVSSTISGIDINNTTGTTTSTLNINANNFTDITHTGSGTGSINLATIATAQLFATVNFNNNTFTNLSPNTTGSFTFFNYAPTLTTGLVMNINDNSIVTGFSKTGAGGTVTFHSTNGSSVTGSTVNINNNNLSNITLTGATSLVLINNTDYASASSGPLKSINGNTISNIVSTTTSGTLTAINNNGGAVGSTVNNNIISGITSASSVVGISLGSSAQSLTVSGNRINTVAVTGSAISVKAIVSATPVISILKNKIYDLQSALSSAFGIEVTAGTTTTIANNYIGDLRSPTTNTVNDLVRGINITSTSTNSTIDVKYNTVYLSGTNSSAQFNTACIFVTGSTTSTTAAHTLRNNIFVNATTGSSGLRAAFKRSTANLQNYTAASNRNLFYGNYIYADGGGINHATLTAYKSYVSARDANSISELPPFLSTTGSSSNFLHIDPSTATGVESGGETSIGTTDDFDGDVRFGESGYSGTGTRPDIGADEFEGTPLPGCTGTPAPSTINAVVNPLCTGQSTTLSLSASYLDLGITYQWRSASVTGGPYTTTLGTDPTQATGTLTATTYYICEITCTNSGLTYTTAELAVTVNALPTVSVTPSSASFCSPGGTAVSLTASGASTYSWSPATGLSATTGANVSANPTSSTTYIVTGTDANGCVNTGSTTISVVPNVSISSTTATPSLICSGDNSQLQVTASIAGGNTAAGMIYASGTGATFETITSPTVVTTVTNGTTDDGYRNVNLSGTFSFNFAGADYDVFSMGSNGYIMMGGSSTSIPTSFTSLSNRVILGFGRDGNLNVTNSGNITHGPAAGGKYVFEYNNHAAASGGGESATQLLSFQIVLWGSTSSTPGRIDLIYGSSTGTPATGAYIGIKDASSTFMNGLNGSTSSTTTATSFPASGTRYTFTQTGPITYAWTPTTFITGQETLANPLATAVTSTTTYSVTASFGACSATGNVEVTVSSGAAITTDPANQTVCEGVTASFTVVATGPSLTYQWRKGGTPLSNGGNISGATSASLVISNTTGADAGSYDVVVTSTCGSPVTSAAATLTVNPLPAVVTVSTAGTYCSSTVLTATNGNDGTIYFQGTTSDGTSTATASTSETITASGTYYFRALSAAGCWGPQGSAVVVIQTPITITPGDGTICQGGSGTMSATSTCESFVNSGTTFSGTWTAATDPTANRPSTSISNSATCSFDASITRNYVATNFQVSVAGNYTFEMNNSASFDGMAYLVSGAFVPGTCPGTGTWIKGDDDGGTAGDEPLLTATLTTGVTYTMISTTYNSTSGTYSGSFGWTVTPPASGQIMLLNSGTIEWYTAASGGSSIGSGSPFNPVGVAGSGLADSNTPGVFTFYAACSNASACRTAVTFTINANANAGTVTGTSPLCIGGSATYSSNGDAGGTWSSTNTGVATVDANTGVVSAIAAGTTDITYTVTNISGCGSPASAFQTLTVSPNVNAGTVSGTSPICAGSNTTYTSNGDAGGTWSSTNTGVATVDANTGVVTAVAAGSTDITYTINTGCGAPVSAFQTLTVDPLAPVSVSISAAPGNAICPGTSVTFTATPTNGGTTPTYQWYNGANPISGETASTYTTTTLVNGDQISVVMTSNFTPCASGNPATSNTITMTVYTAANTPGAISGPIDACPLIGLVTPTTYSISAVAGAVSYQWTVPVGATLVSGQGSTSIDVTFDNTFALTNSQFKVRAVTADGCISAPSALIVNKNIPGIPTVINGPTNACPFVGQPTNATYTIDPVQYATSYTWTVQGTGISLVSGQGSTSVQVSYASNFNTGVIRVVANSNCGSRTARSLNISRQIPSAPVVINGTTNVCSFIGTNAQITYSIDPVANATSYTWTVPANVTLVSGQGTTSINVTFNTGFATSVLKVKSVSNCFTSGDRQLTLTAASTSTPGAISGPNNACTFIGTANEATYTIRKVTSAVSYNWTVPTGVTITDHPGGAGVNDTIIKVTFDNSFVSGTNISVQAVNCNVSSPRNYTVFRYTASTPGLISGPTNACEYMISANLPSQEHLLLIRSVKLRMLLLTTGQLR